MEGKWLSQLLSEAPPVLDWLVEPLIPRGGSFELYGKTGVGKTFLAAQLMVDVASGRMFLDQFRTTKGKVVYVQGELTDQQMRRRFSVLKDIYPEIEKETVWLPGSMVRDLDIPKNFARVADAVNEVEPVLLILDPLSLVMSGDVNSQHDMLRLLKLLDRFRFGEHRVSVGVVHHTRKSRLDSSGFAVTGGYEESGGSRAIIEWSGAIMRLTRKSEEERTLVIEKLRDAAIGEDVSARLKLKWDVKRMVFVSTSASSATQQQEISALLENKDLTKAEKSAKLQAVFGMSRAVAYRKLKEVSYGG